jgi:hypothetical protein
MPSFQVKYVKLNDNHFVCSTDFAQYLSLCFIAEKDEGRKNLLQDLIDKLNCVSFSRDSVHAQFLPPYR